VGGSLRTRLLLTYLLVIGLVLSLIGLSLAVFLINNSVAQRTLYQRMEAAGRLLAEREAQGFFGASPQRLSAALERLGLPDGRALIVEPDGAISLDSQPDAPPPAPEVLAGAISRAPKRGILEEFASGSLYVGFPVGENRTLMVLAPRPRLRALAILGDDLLRPLLQAGIVALVASIIFAWLIARWVAAPLQRMAGAARAVAAGDYRAPPVPRGPAEMESLAVAFGDMVRKVKASQQAQRDFVANVSHELRTPLTSIQGFAQAILDGTAGAAGDQAQAARVIFEESDRLHRLVEDLLDLARLDAGQIAFRREPVAMEALVRGVAERLSLRAAEKQIQVEVDIGRLPQVVGDGDRLAQVFTNLLDNALQYTPPGASVRVHARSEAGEIWVSVEDSGPGIPADELPRLFERFYQVDKARPKAGGRGVGLGLAISREIVQAHGGKLTAESAPGKGSRFTVRLPAAQPTDSTLAALKRRV
jgi:two-component system, OmpR family, sensor kinase